VLLGFYQRKSIGTCFLSLILIHFCYALSSSSGDWLVSRAPEAFLNKEPHNCHQS
jgi:hypothetical protein